VIDWSRFDHGNRLVRHEGPTTRTFIRSPGFETPAECWSWLFSQGVAHHDGRVEQGPDGCWRGSGEVTGG
jgi:hypothetical protein